MQIEQNIGVYTSDNNYDIDNSIMLSEYPVRIMERIIATGKEPEEVSLLELGLGHGYSAQVFEKYFNNYTILDGDSRIIEQYLSKYPNSKANIIETYFETFDTYETFDVIVMGFVLEHVDKPVEILKKYAKYLRKDGMLFISVPNAESLNRRLGKIMGILENLEDLSENDIKLGHRRYYTANTLKQDIYDSQLEMISLEGIYPKPLTTGQLKELNLSSDVYNALCVVGRNYPELCLGLLAETRIK